MFGILVVWHISNDISIESSHFHTLKLLQLRLINQETEKQRERGREKGKAAQTNGKMFLANCNLLQHIDAVCLPSSPFSFSLSPHRYLHIFPLKRQLKWKCATTTTRNSKAYTIRSWIIYRASCMNVTNKRKRSLRFMIVQIFLRFAAAKLTRTYLSATCNLPQDLGVSTYTRRTHDLPTCHTLPHTERDTHLTIVPEIVGENVIKIALHKSHRRPKRNMLHTRQRRQQPGHNLILRSMRPRCCCCQLVGHKLLRRALELRLHSQTVDFEVLFPGTFPLFPFSGVLASCLAEVRFDWDRNSRVRYDF